MFVDGGDVKDVGIIFDEVLQQTRELRSVGGIVHILDPTGQGENLALAEKPLAQILFELQGFAGERTRNFGLLDALGVLQFFFAEAQDLAVVKPQRRDADEQQGAQHNPEDAQTPGRCFFEGFYGHRIFIDKMLAKWKRRNNGTKVLGLANKLQRDWDLGRSSSHGLAGAALNCEINGTASSL